MKKKKQIDLRKYFKLVDFNSPQVLMELEKVKEEIKNTLDAAKVDRIKMFIVFQTTDSRQYQKRLQKKLKE